MKQELLPFYLTPGLTKKVLNEVNSTEPHVYVQRTMNKAEKNHPALREYFDTQSKLYPDLRSSYDKAASVTYEIASRQLDLKGCHITIQPEDMAAHGRRAADVFVYQSDPSQQLVKKKATRKAPLQTEAFTLFTYALKMRAPELYRYTKGVLSGLPEIESQVAALRGVFDGFMPFYIKSLISGELGKSLDVDSDNNM
jgi:hypothetical protein